MKILITGGNGFIAKELHFRFQRDRHNVVSCSKQLLNLLDINLVESYLKNNSIDIVIHTAVKGGRKMEEDIPEDFYHNILMLENLLFLSDHYKKMFIFSSGAEYDRRHDIKEMKEGIFRSVPRDYYGLSKYIGTRLCRDNHKIINLRIFNCFGFRELEDRFIKTCIEKCLKNEPFYIFQNRFFDFFYVEDLYKVIQHFLSNMFILDEMFGEYVEYNCCYKEKHTLYGVASLIQDCLKTTNKIIIENEYYLGNSYTGDGTELNSLKINFVGLLGGIREMCDLIKKEKVECSCDDSPPDRYDIPD